MCDWKGDTVIGMWRASYYIKLLTLNSKTERALFKFSFDPISYYNCDYKSLIEGVY
jgi:hypothetical protein